MQMYLLWSSLVVPHILINYLKIEAFNSMSRYLDDLLNIDNPYFEGMVF